MTGHTGGILRFNILGPIEAWSGDARLPLGGAIHQRVLSSLLLEAGRTIPVTRLVQAAWNEEPPTTAVHQVRKAVADLRRRIPNGGEVVLTDGPGYRTVVRDPELDLIEFTTCTREADRAVSAGRPADAIAALRRALGLWRGTALSGSGSRLLESAAATLEERRLAAAEQFFELRLAAGEAGQLVPELRDLISQHPLRETLRGQLMLALYRSGRQGEALGEYVKVRELLVEELGIDPGALLSGLYEAILRESPELNPPVAAPTGRAESVAAPETEQWPTPCTLPNELSDFTGRARELGELFARTTGPDGSRTSRIVAIDGMGGSGKTCLAIQAAHQMAADFPDGQLHIDLRGFTPGESPVDAATALYRLLRILGVASDSVPDDLDGRAALWRSTLADRRVLLLLDNAVDARQVRPLLPASPGCLVMITSRERLVDLDGAEWISIGPMSPEDGTLLVKEVLGADRVAAEPEAARELVRLCGRLPLALRIVAARLRNRPKWTLRYLVERLNDETHRLEELSGGERSVAATLQLSYQAMDETHRTAFRLLGLHCGADIDAYAAAALLDSDLRDAEAALERLLDVHLLQQPAMGLYRFHDLVRTFAQNLTSAATAHEDSTAVGRILDYYWTATEAACGVLFPGRNPARVSIEPYAGALPQFRTTGEAADWFGREQEGLIASVHLADRERMERHTVGLTRNVVFWLNGIGRFREFRELSQIAVKAARRSGDLAVLGFSLSNLSVACWKLGHLDEGIGAATEGRDVAAQLGDRCTEAHAESTIGLLLTVLGRHAEALPHLERALALEQELDLPRAEAETLCNLSTLYMQWGRYEEAAEAARQALEIHRTVSYRDNHVMALADLAFVHMVLGEFEQAHEQLRTARALFTVSSPPGDMALVLALSAEVGECLGIQAEVAGCARRALELASSCGSPTRQAKVENVMGRLHRRRGEFQRAMELHRHAYDLAATMRYRAEEAHALCGIAEAAAALGDTGTAAGNAAKAEELFRFMGWSEHAAACCLTAR
ncbi:BTAD domain-containing putative transcriptional regulator [Streptomyces hawaiiensis]|uniref:AfsR/SARP family transcriptional regulator n=1 Tax=Streptomyces hawaiiensis TaxID=67305 RepID=UPI00364F1AB6